MITWNIAQLERTLPDGTVVTAHWRVNAVDEEFTASNYGSASFTRNENDEGFIPFEDLTEEIVIGWVKDSMGDSVAETEARLAADIDAKRNPAKASGVPWA
jgi:hypothetical protein